MTENNKEKKVSKGEIMLFSKVTSLGYIDMDQLNEFMRDNKWELTQIEFNPFHKPVVAVLKKI